MEQRYFANLIGNTELVRLKTASDQTGCNILGKAEFMNPGQSVKDRAALFIIEDAIQKGLLRKGGTIVEGTAGNTGIGLTLIGRSKGFKSVIVIPNTQSKEKKDWLKNSGAQLLEVPAVPYSDPNNYIRYSERLALALNKQLPEGAFWANQFDNLANKNAHIKTTGPEILLQTGGKIDAFICSVGTGGTLSGVSSFLKEEVPNIKIALADPWGSALYNFYSSGKLSSSGGSISEGIGQGRITENLKGLAVDLALRVDDIDALDAIYDLLYNEGLSIGISAGINVAGAVQLAKTLEPGSTIVTILCDHGSRYQSKIFNKSFLAERNLLSSKFSDNQPFPLPSVKE